MTVKSLSDILASERRVADTGKVYNYAINDRNHYQTLKYVDEIMKGHGLRVIGNLKREQ